MNRLLGFGCFTGAALLVIACGSARDESGGTGPGNSSGTSGDPPNTGVEPPSAEPSVDGPLTFTDRLVGWSAGYTGGFYPAHGYAVSKNRLFSIPDALSPTLRAITLVDVTDAAKPRVVTLPVTGTPPAGSVEAFTYDHAADRVLLVVRSPSALDVQLVSLALEQSEAKFTTVAQSGMPKTNSLLGPLHATGKPGAVVVGAGNTTATITVAGSTATWSGVTPVTIFAGNVFGVMEDPVHDRVLSVGHHVYDPVTKTVKLEPAVKTLALTAPYGWSPLPFGGDLPPTGDAMTGYNFSVYDEKGDRVLASFLHDTECFTGQPPPCRALGLWSFALATNTWSKVEDRWTSAYAYSPRPFLVEHARRRILRPSDGGLMSTSLDPSNASLAETTLALDGDLGPSMPIAAATLPDGRIVATDGGAFRVIDPADKNARWTRFGTVVWPTGVERGASLTVDSKTGELVVFGAGQSENPSEIDVLTSDGKKITKITPTGASPAPRSDHAAALVDGILYVAGGAQGMGATTYDDVWAFDRAKTAWTKLATLPAKLSSATMSIAANGELLVLGYETGETSAAPHVFAIDRQKKSVRELDAPPAKAFWASAPYRGCFLGYESGDTVDGSAPTAWRCEIDSSNGAVRWTSTKLAEHDFALNGLRGTSSPDGKHAYFVGRHLWDVVGR